MAVAVLGLKKIYFSLNIAFHDMDTVDPPIIGTISYSFLQLILDIWEYLFHDNGQEADRLCGKCVPCGCCTYPRVDDVPIDFR